jgi:hypothetical protein
LVDPRLLRLYTDELTHLQEVGAEFAREFPKIASRLGMEGAEVADPYVERLLEGFAFLAARVQLKLDAEQKRLTAHLLGSILEDCQRRLEALQVERDIFPREEAIGIDVGERRRRAVRAIDDEQTRLAVLQKRHEKEIEQRAELRPAGPVRPAGIEGRRERARKGDPPDLIRYEPRILADTLEVRAIAANSVLDTHNVIEFEIRGHQWSQPVPLEILLRTQLEAGQVEVRDQRLIAA